MEYYSNEFQAAFALSQSEFKVDNSEKVFAEEAAANGKFPVCYDQLIHCRFTDAVIGSQVAIDAVFDTEAEALKYIDGEECGQDLYIRSEFKPAPPAPAPIWLGDDLPF